MYKILAGPRRQFYANRKWRNKFKFNFWLFHIFLTFRNYYWLFVKFFRNFKLYGNSNGGINYIIVLNGNIFLKKDRQNSEKNLYANFLTEFKKSFEFDEHFGYYFLMFLMFEKNVKNYQKFLQKITKKCLKIYSKKFIYTEFTTKK